MLEKQYQQEHPQFNSNDMHKLIKSFDYEIESGKNYDSALRSLTTYAKSMGIALQYADYSDFEAAMINGETFKIE